MASVFEKNGNGCVGTYSVEAVDVLANYLRSSNTLNLESNNGTIGVVMYGGSECAFQPRDDLSGQMQCGTPWGAWKSVFAANSYSSDGVVVSDIETFAKEDVTIDNVIDNIEFIHGRAEDFGKLEEYREKYDIATARAVAGLPILMEFCVPFVKVGGYFVCLKGPNANLELEESKAAMDVLGVEFIEK